MATPNTATITNSTLITRPRAGQTPERHARILLTTPPEGRAGGVSQYFRTLRTHWNNEVTYLTVGSRGEGERSGTAGLRMARDSWNFLRALLAERFDLVHLNPSLGPKAAIRDGILLLAASTMRRRTVVFIHGWDEHFEKRVHGRYSRLFAAAINRADACVVLAEDFVARLRALGYQKKIFVGSAPVDDELVADANTLAADERDPARFTVLFLARIEKDKGIYEAVDAYRIVKRRFPSVRLMVAGDGPELAAVRNRVEDEDVSFTGHVAGRAKQAIFRMADAYLFPSHHEGLPISVLEAMAYGIPVVTSRVGGLPDFFLDGRMGFMSPSRAPEELAALLERLIVDPSCAARIRDFNRQYAREHFTGSRIAADLERVYASVCQRPD